MEPVLKYKIINGLYVGVNHIEQIKCGTKANEVICKCMPIEQQCKLYDIYEHPDETIDEEPIGNVLTIDELGFFAKLKDSTLSFLKKLFIHLKKMKCTSKTAIPKHIYMVWIGDNVPEYAYFAKAAYEKMNPKFKVSLLHYTVDDVLNGDDPIMQKAALTVIDTKMGLPNRYYDTVRRYVDEGRTFCLAVANIFRFILLEENGGIYVDCDSFPVKPFDDGLLEKPFTTKVKTWRNILKSKDYDAVHTYEDHLYDLQYKDKPNEYKYYEYQDIFFFGLSKASLDVSYKKYVKVNGDMEKNVFIRNNDNLEEFNKLRDMFFKCDSKLHEHINDMEWHSYIAHFKDRTWLEDNAGKIRSPRCLIDDFDSLDLVKWLDRPCLLFIDYGFSKYVHNSPNSSRDVTLTLYTSADEVPKKFKTKATAENCLNAVNLLRKIDKAMLEIASSREE